MILESSLEVTLINKLLSVVATTELNDTIMNQTEFVTIQDILRKASASFINRQERDTVGDLNVPNE